MTDDLAIPYCGAALSARGLIFSWNLDPALLLALAGLLALGLRHARRPGLFGLGWAGLVLAFVAPLCAATVLAFSARSLHHLLLLTLAAPALAMGLPLRAVPPAGAFGVTVAALVGWHLPALYSAAWDHAGVYWLMQLALLLGGWAFWSHVLTPRGGELLAPALMVGGLAGAMGLIGAVLTFAPHPLYAEHLAGAAALGLTPLADQRLAGLLMWVVGLGPLAALSALAGGRVWRRGAA